VWRHRHNLHYQKQIAKEPPVAKYLTDLVKSDAGYKDVAEKIKQLVLVGWECASSEEKAEVL